jgi:biopolymer transport protein ExbB/TolQ
MTSSFGAQSQLINALSGGGIQFYASQKNATPLDIINSSSFIVTMLGTIIISIVILAAQTSANLQDKTKLDIKKTLAATTAALKQALQQAAASELAVETRRRQWRTLSAAALQEQFKREVKLNVERGTARAHAKYYKGLAETCEIGRAHV